MMSCSLKVTSTEQSFNFGDTNVEVNKTQLVADDANCLQGLFEVTFPRFEVAYGNAESGNLAE